MRKFPVIAKSNRADAVRLFQKAIEVVEGHTYVGVCAALGQSHANRRQMIVKLAIVSWIMDNISPHSYLEDWIEGVFYRGQRRELRKAVANHLSHMYYVGPAGEWQEKELKKLRKTRVAWLRWMIAQVKEQK